MSTPIDTAAVSADRTQMTQAPDATGAETRESEPEPGSARPDMEEPSPSRALARRGRQVGAQIRDHGPTALLVSVVVGLLGVGVVLLAGALNGLGDRIDDANDRIDETNDRIDETNLRITRLEERIDARFASQDEKIDRLEDKMEQRFGELGGELGGKIDELDDKIDELDDKFDDIGLKLTALIASLDKTDDVDGALEGRLT